MTGKTVNGWLHDGSGSFEMECDCALVVAMDDKGDGFRTDTSAHLMGRTGRRDLGLLLSAAVALVSRELAEEAGHSIAKAVVGDAVARGYRMYMRAANETERVRIPYGIADTDGDEKEEEDGGL